MDEIKDDIREIKGHVLDLVKQGAIHNELLKEHERRSLALEDRQDTLDTRIMPLERYVGWTNIIIKSLGAILIGVIIKLLSNKL
jgi:hypothetical protein